MNPLTERARFYATRDELRPVLIDCALILLSMAGIVAMLAKGV